MRHGHKENCCAAAGICFKRFDVGDGDKIYNDPGVETAWQAWLASASQQPYSAQTAAVPDGFREQAHEILRLRGLTNAQAFLAIKDIVELIAAAPAPDADRICETMGRPVAECGCPDCGSSLIDMGHPASAPEPEGGTA